MGRFDLTAIGVAGIIGAGIFVVLGLVARDVTGPAVIVSFAVAGVAALLSALVLAEFAGMVPGSGALYDYAYAALGRLPAFFVGWSTIAAYIVGNMAVAVGWSSFFVSGVQTTTGGLVPNAVANGALAGGVVNVPAMAIMAVVTGLTLVKVRESATVNNILVVFKVGVVLLFVVLGAFLVDPANWRPFAPFGFDGVMAGAAALVFAYLGFDTVCAAGEEARRPQRDLPIGILASVGIAAVLYMGMGAIVTGMQPVSTLDGNAPLAEAFSSRGFAWAGLIITVGALAAMTTVMFAFHLALGRILTAMADDGFLPAWLGRVHSGTGTPWGASIAAGVVTVLGAGAGSLAALANLTVVSNIFIFLLVSVGVLVLRRVAPDLPRTFRVHPTVPVGAMVVLLGILVTGVGGPILLSFTAWTGVGLMVFGFGGRRRGASAPERVAVVATES